MRMPYPRRESGRPAPARRNVTHRLLSVGAPLLAVVFPVFAALAAHSSECVPGETETVLCGPCASQTRTCEADSTWGPFGPCLPDDSAILPDGNPCTEDLCFQGIPSYVPLPQGTPCPGGECDGNGVCVPSVSVELLTEERPGLEGNTPNPFEARTRIHFDLHRPSRVRLDVFDVNGRLVRALIRDEELGQGRHAAEWDGVTDGGSAAPAGIYFCRLRAGDFSVTRRMTMLR